MYTLYVQDKLVWDENKRIINLQKHGLNFEDAIYVFENQTERVTFRDNRQQYSEERNITLGHLKGRLVVIVHTRREEQIRIISMRKANEREKKIYQKRLKAFGSDDGRRH